MKITSHCIYVNPPNSHCIFYFYYKSINKNKRQYCQKSFGFFRFCRSKIWLLIKFHNNQKAVIIPASKHFFCKVVKEVWYEHLVRVAIKKLVCIDRPHQWSIRTRVFDIWGQSTKTWWNISIWSIQVVKSKVSRSIPFCANFVSVGMCDAYIMTIECVSS